MVAKCAVPEADGHAEMSCSSQAVPDGRQSEMVAVSQCSLQSGPSHGCSLSAMPSAELRAVMHDSGAVNVVVSGPRLTKVWTDTDDDGMAGVLTRAGNLVVGGGDDDG